MRNAKKDGIEMAAKRDAMLREGFRLFSEHGIEQVAMTRVAEACGVGIATLYRYYKTKAALVVDIAAEKWEEYAEYVRGEHARRDVSRMSAAENLGFYLDFYIELYRDHKDLLRFNQDFNNFVRHEEITAEQLAPYFRAIGSFTGMFSVLYEKGKRDGTIRTDLPEEKMFAATSHIMLAVAVRYAQGLVFASEREEDRTGEYELLKRMILREYTVERSERTGMEDIK